MAEKRGKFPQSAEILSNEWTALKQREPRQEWTVRKAASQLKISPSAFSSWLQGRRRPSPNQIGSLARLLASSSEHAQRLEEALRAAIGERGLYRPDTLRRILAERPPTLRVGFIVYPKFSANGEDSRPNFGFFGDFLNSFAGYMGCHLEATAVDLDDASDELCNNGTYDLLAGIFATPDRALAMKFFSTPIRVPLNGIELDPHTGGDSKSLLEGKLSNSHHRKFHLVVAEDEAGDLFVRNTLRIDLEAEGQGSRERYDEHELAVRMRKGPVTTRQVICVADDLMCRRTKSQLGKEGTNSELLFVVDPKKPMPMPTFQLCMAVDRRDAAWIDYLTDALGFFLHSNGTLIADHLLSLAARLSEQPESVDQDWLEYCLWDTGDLPESDPWKSIVNVARSNAAPQNSNSAT